MDRNGSVLIPVRFGWASSFREGLAVVELDGKYGFINSDGTTVVPPTFDNASPFSEGLAAACTGDRCGFVDHSGKFAIPPQYGTKITYPGVGAFSEGLAAVFTNGKWGYIDKTCKLVIPAQYDFAQDFSEGLAAVGVTGRPPSFGFIDHNGQVVIPLHYHGVASFHEGVAVVIGPELLGKCYGSSVIERSGGRVYGPLKESISDYHEGLASTHSLENEVRFIDRQGTPAMRARFAGDGTFFSEGLAPVSSYDTKSGGYINKTGEFVIEGRFGMACPFTQGLAFVQTAQWAGYIDTKGHFIWKTPLSSLGDSQTESCPDY